MTGVRAADADGPQPAVADSITELGSDHRGAVAVVASHGGRYTASVAMTLGLRGLICNDAGVGCAGAGIQALSMLDEIGLAVAALGYLTGRIGDGADCYRNGVITSVNNSAEVLGCRVGQTVREAARLMIAAEPVAPRQGFSTESRFRLDTEDTAVPVWGIDSASLARDTDRGAILVTGSHGALLGNRPHTALKAPARAALFNDAGGGPDGRGRTRLPVLDERGIAAVTVSASSAVIGSARSTYEDGLVSFANLRAAEHGARPGMPAAAFVELVRRH